MYCERTDLHDYIPAAYLAAADKVTPGIVERKIASVCGAIDDALRRHYALPLATVPETIKRMAAVMATYESIGGITAVKDDTSADNKLLVLQDLYKQARKDLALIRDNRLELGLDELGLEPSENTDGAMAVVTRPATFNLKGWR